MLSSYVKILPNSWLMNKSARNPAYRIFSQYVFMMSCLHKYIYLHVRVYACNWWHVRLVCGINTILAHTSALVSKAFNVLVRPVYDINTKEKGFFINIHSTQEVLRKILFLRAYILCGDVEWRVYLETGSLLWDLERKRAWGVGRNPWVRSPGRTVVRIHPSSAVQGDKSS